MRKTVGEKLEQGRRLAKAGPVGIVPSFDVSVIFCNSAR